MVDGKFKTSAPPGPHNAAKGTLVVTAHPPSHLVLQAINIATTAHAHQLDRQGQPYIGHPARVAARVPHNSWALVVAWLHDVLEKTELTATDLTATFPPHVVAAVVAISRAPGESLESYCARIRANPLATQVKHADLTDNNDPTRLAVLDATTRQALSLQYQRTQDLIGPHQEADVA